MGASPEGGRGGIAFDGQVEQFGENLPVGFDGGIVELGAKMFPEGADTHALREGDELVREAEFGEVGDLRFGLGVDFQTRTTAALGRFEWLIGGRSHNALFCSSLAGGGSQE